MRPISLGKLKNLESNSFDNLLPAPKHYTEIILKPGDHILITDCVKPTPEIIAWCSESVSHMWAYDIHIAQFSADLLGRYRLHFYFEDAKEAILFKLSWL